MKKNISVIIVVLFAISSANAQNIFPDFGNAGIGIRFNLPAPLSFKDSLGKKISLYSGRTGDVGFDVWGNELRIHSDYAGADITFGYDTYNNPFTERMRIKGNGNIGIGVADNLPGRLNVQSDGSINNPQLLLTQTGSNDYSRIKFKNGNSAANGRFWDIAAIVANGSNTQANDKLNFFNPAVGDVLSLSGDGTVSIKGPLAINGNKGNAGQVLTSRGNGAQQWVNPVVVKTFQNTNPLTITSTSANVLAVFNVNLQQQSAIIMSANIVYNSLDIATNSIIETWFTIDGFQRSYVSLEYILAGYSKTVVIANSTITLNPGPHTIQLFTQRKFLPITGLLSGSYRVVNLDATVLTTAN